MVNASATGRYDSADLLDYTLESNATMIRMTVKLGMRPPTSTPEDTYEYHFGFHVRDGKGEVWTSGPDFRLVRSVDPEYERALVAAAGQTGSEYYVPVEWNGTSASLAIEVALMQKLFGEGFAVGSPYLRAAWSFPNGNSYWYWEDRLVGPADFWAQTQTCPRVSPSQAAPIQATPPAPARSSSLAFLATLLAIGLARPRSGY